jgi:hypothetical protein
MKLVICFVALFTLTNVRCQLLFDPTLVYEAEGGGTLFDRATVHDIKLDFYDPGYHTILTDRWFAKDPTPLPAALDLGTVHFDSVGASYKGNSTFYIADLLSNPKVPYNIDINYYISGQKLLGYKKLKLANALFDPTFVKEALAATIYQNYLPTHQVNIVRLTVNGTYIGAYVNTESIGKQFLDKHFGEKDGAFVKCEPSAQYGTSEVFVPASLIYEGTDTMNYYESYEIKSDDADTSWARFIEFLDILNNDETNVESVLNVDRVLWFFAVSTVLPNEDTYNTMYLHNYYFYQTADGKFQIIPWDLSESFCGALVGNGTHADHYERDPAYGYTPLVADRPLIYRLLSQPYYFKRYIHHVRTVLNEMYDQTALKNLALDMQATAVGAVSADPNKLFTMGDYVDNLDNNMFWWTTELAGITQTINNRRPFLESHPEIIKAEPVILNVTQTITNPSSTDTVYISAEVTNADNVYLKVTNNPEMYASGFIQIPMLDNGLNGDLSAGDNSYTAAVPFTGSNDHIKYYIEAENAQAMALMPKHAEYFYYHYYVDQVVGGDELALQKIILYPNPVIDLLTVQHPFETANIDIFTIAGNHVVNYPGIGKTSIIDCSNLKSGIYLMVIYSGGHRAVEKFQVG